MAANESVIKYIKQASAQGHSLERIRKALIEAGWSEQDISDSIRQASAFAPAQAVQQLVQPSLSEKEILDKQKFGFFDVIKKPKLVFSVEKNRAVFGKAVRNYAIVGVICGVIIALIALFLSSFIGSIAVIEGIDAISAVSGFGVEMALVAFIASVIGLVLSGIITAAFILICSKLIGGKASFKQIFYLNSLYLLPYTICLIAAGVIAIIPVIGWLILLFVIVYNVYLQYLVIKEANEFKKEKAITAMAIMILLALVISAIISVLTASVLSAPFSTGLNST